MEVTTVTHHAYTVTHHTYTATHHTSTATHHTYTATHHTNTATHHTSTVTHHAYTEVVVDYVVRNLVAVRGGVVVSAACATALGHLGGLDNIIH